MAVSNSLREKLLSIFRTPEVTDEVVQTLNDGLILPESEGGIPVVATVADLPAGQTDGTVYVVSADHRLYVFRTGINRWYGTYIVSQTPGVTVSQSLGIDAKLVTTTISVDTSLGYTPGQGTDWSPEPTTIQEALDQLAARVKALEP